MGVRFACHACGKRLNIKTELAGRRGICPGCSVRFRIPAYDTATSTPLENDDSGSSGESDSRVDSPVNSVPDSQAGGVAIQSKRSNLATASAVGVEPAASPQTNGYATAATESSGELEAAADGPRDAMVSRNHPHKGQPSLREVLGGATATWYVRPPSGGQYGPADGPTMGQWMQEGRVADIAMVWRDGWTEWQVAKEAIPGVVPEVVPTTPSSTEVLSGPVSNAPVPHDDPASSVEQVEVTQRSGPLESNKKKRSQKRIVMSIVLGLIFVALVTAFVIVLWN